MTPWRHTFDIRGQWTGIEHPAQGRTRRPAIRVERQGLALRCVSPAGVHWTAQLCAQYYDAEFEVLHPLMLPMRSTQARQPSLRQWAAHIAPQLSPWMDGSCWRLSPAELWVDWRALNNGFIDFASNGHGGLIPTRAPNPSRVRAWRKVAEPPPVIGWHVSPLTATLVIDGVDRLAAHPKCPVLVLSNGAWVEGEDRRPAAQAHLEYARRQTQLPPQVEALMQRRLVSAWDALRVWRPATKAWRWC